MAYGERRLREARRALHELGGETIRAEHLLGFPDGWIEPLLAAHWQREHPERSTTTGVSKPPYSEAEHQEARYDGDDLRTALVRCFSDAQPTMIAFPDPLDRHPDHRATGRFTLLALREITHGQKGTQQAMPRLLAEHVHGPDWPPGWNASRPSTPTDSALDLPSSLPARGLERVILTLTQDEVTRKRRALDQYTSQQQVMPSLLAAFVRRTEPFTLFRGTE